ncbi:hypothetical protein LOK49_LG05G01871 [Camellia lanceoleosa]|uniref:Uncharacterized protein n=1 Tax=Camellia lanceoleosa TaxID=1840588 RepID=A0ACC0HPI1_9ERIC|nr:hypothetical protein LOK49_LG05G01871 [Camellia lanceoleosa]
MEYSLSKSPKQEEEAEAPGRGGGWGGWGFSPFSVLSDLQKAATVTAQEISRNAVDVARTAAKSITDMQNVAEDSESSKEGDREEFAVEGEDEDEDKFDNQRKAALDKLEKSSEDSFLGQGLKVLDSSVENFTSGAWQALGSALRGGSNFVQKLEHSAENLAESIQHGGPVGPSIIESGKAFTARGMQVLQLVGKEVMDLLIIETGIGVGKNLKGVHLQDDEEQSFEEVTFDRCFYIYGGPERLEELEAFSNHYALLFNRRKAKLSSEQKSFYDGKLKLVQQFFNLISEIDGSALESEKEKKIDIGAEGGADEIKNLHDSSVRKAAEMAAGFTNTLAGLAKNDIVQRIAGRLDSLHSEGFHRLSEMSCFAVSQLLMLGQSIISNANKVRDEDLDVHMLNIDWLEDSRKSITDVAEAYIAAIKGATVDSQVLPQKSIQEKANAFSKTLCSDLTTTMGKIQDGLQYLSYVVLSTSMPAA